jgi:hypothetical protein
VSASSLHFLLFFLGIIAAIVVLFSILYIQSERDDKKLSGPFCGEILGINLVESAKQRWNENTAKDRERRHKEGWIGKVDYALWYQSILCPSCEGISKYNSSTGLLTKVMSLMERWEKVEHLAKEIIQGDIDILAGAWRMAAIGSIFGDDPDLKVFFNLNDESPYLPMGKVRLYWSTVALIEKDKELVELEKRYEQPVLDACHKLIERFKGSKWTRQ